MNAFDSFFEDFDIYDAERIREQATKIYEQKNSKAKEK